MDFVPFDSLEKVLNPILKTKVELIDLLEYHLLKKEEEHKPLS